MKNAFGMNIYEISDLLEEREVERYVNSTLSVVFEHLEIPMAESKILADKCIGLAKNCNDIPDYEKEVHDLLEEFGITRKFSRKLFTRSLQVFFQIKKYLIDGSVLDLGCGDGKIGALLGNNGHKVVLSDIYENPNIKNTGLDFRGFNEGDNIPAEENEFDNCLALTVFHHSNNPVKTLKEIYRVTKNNGRVIVIESVYGVNGPGEQENGNTENKEFVSLKVEQQRMVNIYFDHFYNRIINYTNNPKEKALVPYNFNTPEGWQKLFEINGFVQEKIIHLGIDQPLVPEYHTLHILNVTKDLPLN